MKRWLNCVDPVTASGDITMSSGAMIESIDGAELADVAGKGL